MLEPIRILPGSEQYEEFYSHILKKTMVQYDYRAKDGELFSTTGKTLAGCREKRNHWIRTRLQGSKV